MMQHRQPVSISEDAPGYTDFRPLVEAAEYTQKNAQRE